MKLTQTQVKIILFLEFFLSSIGFLYLSYYSLDFTMWLFFLLISVVCFFFSLTILAR